MHIVTAAAFGFHFFVKALVFRFEIYEGPPWKE